MSFFIDGIETDYPQTNNRGDGMDLGQINCCRADHMVQEAVDPETGETHAVMRRVRYSDGTTAMAREWRGGFDELTGEDILPKRRGVCQACWLEARDPRRANCTLHGNNLKVAGVEGCPICGIDPAEKRKAVAYERKLAEVSAITVGEGDALEDPTRPGVPLVFSPADADARREALALRRAAGIITVSR